MQKKYTEMKLFRRTAAGGMSTHMDAGVLRAATSAIVIFIENMKKTWENR